VIGVAGVPQFAYGGSVVAEITGMTSTTLPSVDYASFANYCALIREAFARDIVLAVRDVSDGGILATVAEMACAALDDRSLGAELIHWDKLHNDDRGIGVDIPGNSMSMWFAEFPGFVCEVADWTAFQRLGNECGVKTFSIGHTIAEPFMRTESQHQISVQRLRDAWQAPLRDFYGSVA